MVGSGVDDTGRLVASVVLGAVTKGGGTGCGGVVAGLLRGAFTTRGWRNEGGGGALGFGFPTQYGKGFCGAEIDVGPTR